MSVLDEIRKLDEQKAKLLQGAKEEALAQAHAAIATLGEIGFSYRLIEGDKPLISRIGNQDGGKTGVRNTGIRNVVLSRIKVANKGLSASEVMLLMNPGDDAGKTSVRNALAALKRTGQVNLVDGKYTAKA